MGGFFWFALPKDSSSFNNFVLLYDPLTGHVAPDRASLYPAWQNNTGKKQSFIPAVLTASPYVSEQWIGSNDLGTKLLHIGR